MAKDRYNNIKLIFTILKELIILIKFINDEWEKEAQNVEQSSDD